MPTVGVVRALVVLIELDYTADPSLDPLPNGLPSWPVHAQPDWVNNPDPTQNLFDSEVLVGIPQGMMTRYLHDASSGNFTLIADYLVAPTNGGIFHMPTTTGLVFGITGVPDACAAVNAEMAGVWNTEYSHNAPSDYDHWTIAGSGLNGPGLTKAPQPESPYKYDNVIFIFRNARDASDGFGRASWGWPSSANLLVHQANTYNLFGARNGAPVKMMCHEFSHLLFGGNNFHCAGGGNNLPPHYVPQYFISQCGGWSLMGLSGSSLMTWCGWDRLRMGWKEPGQANLIAARNATNTIEVRGDLDPLDPSDAGIYVLRDFVNSGDVLRIKMPYTDPLTEYPEFIWVENHQGRNQNGHPFDRWQFEDASCVVDLEPGLFMYMQIDRELHQTTASSGTLYGGFEDFLNPMRASGRYDVMFHPQPDPSTCVGPYAGPAVERVRENPFSGANEFFIPVDKAPYGVISRNGGDFDPFWREYDNGVVYDNLFSNGHARHGFSFAGNHKLGIGTNPSSASAMNVLGGNGDEPTNKNHYRIQLNGISVEMLEQLPDGSLKVQVRFDDVDITNDARWCADMIELNPVPTVSGHSLNITSGKKLHLDQGLTATRRQDPITFNGQSIFASPTVMRCKDQTWFNLESNSEVVVDNNSTLRLEAGSRLDVATGAVLRVKRGGKLELEGGSVLNVANGGLVVIEQGPNETPALDATLIYHANARINVEGTTGEVRIGGQLDIRAGATFTLGQATDPTWTRGRLRFNNTRVAAHNVISTPTSRFSIRSNNKQRRILYVEQIGLEFAQLELFELERASACLKEGSYLRPAPTAQCTVRVVDARVTSLVEGMFNDHLGLSIYGQPQMELVGSTFGHGRYGIMAINVLGPGPRMVDCDMRYCTTGLYTLYKNFDLTDCRFFNNGTGMRAEQLAQGSFLTRCIMQNNTTGATIQGATTLMVEDPLVTGNTDGLVLEQTDARVECGSISSNTERGIHVKSDGVLRMDGTKSQVHSPVTMVGNRITIGLTTARNVYLNDGHNDLTPTATGVGRTINGTVVCATAGIQPAYRNIWKGSANTPLTNAEYSVTRWCPSFPPPALHFGDPHGTTAAPCGQAVPPCPEPPCHIVGRPAAGECPDCRVVETETYGALPLNEASDLALTMALAEDVEDNERQAMAGLREILNATLEDPNEAEKAILDYDYLELRSSFGEALRKEQLVLEDEEAVMVSLTDLTAIQEQRIDDAVASGDSFHRLYTVLDQAQANRQVARFAPSIALLDDALTWAPEEELALVERIRCLTVLERDLYDGTIGLGDLYDLDAICGGGAVKSMVADVSSFGDELETDVPVTAILPNPSNGEVLVVGFMEQRNRLQVFDASGRSVAEQVFEDRLNTDLDLARGVYTYRIQGSGGAIEVGRLVIAR